MEPYSPKLGNSTGLVSILHHIINIKTSLYYLYSAKYMGIWSNALYGYVWAELPEGNCFYVIVNITITLQQTTYPFICHLKRTSHVVLELIYFLWKTWCLQNENITFYHPELVMRVFHLTNAKLGHVTNKNGLLGRQPRWITFSFDLHNSSQPAQPHSIIAK